MQSGADASGQKRSWADFRDASKKARSELVLALPSQPGGEASSPARAGAGGTGERPWASRERPNSSSANADELVPALAKLALV